MLTILNRVDIGRRLWVGMNYVETMVKGFILRNYMEMVLKSNHGGWLFQIGSLCAELWRFLTLWETGTRKEKASYPSFSWECNVQSILRDDAKYCILWTYT